MNLTAPISSPNAALSGPDPAGKQVIGFEVHQPRARSVWLLGIVGDWHPSFVKFERHGPGLWAAKLITRTTKNENKGTTKMKRISALILTAIALAISLPGCASQDDDQLRQSDGHTHTH